MNLVYYRHHVVLFVLLISASAFGQTWNWAAQVATFSTGGFGTNKVVGITVDANENIYIVGDYGDSATIGGIKVKGFGNGSEMYVAKFNSSGTASWAKSFGSSGFLDQSIDITNDALGNVYVCGAFFGSWDFGTVQYPFGSATVGIAKYNSNGDVLWAKKLPVETAGPGGICYGSNFVCAAVGRTLAKYTLDGDTVWTRTIPVNASYYVQYRDVKIDPWGCVLVTGQFKGSITYGTTTITSSSINDPDIFLVMYDANGTVEWARKAGAVSTPGQEDIGQQIATNDHGEVYLVGQYKGKAGFETDSISTGNAITGMFVAKYTKLGEFQWVKGSSGTTGSTALSYGVQCLSNGDILVAGSFGIGTVMADTTITIAGGADVLMLRLTSDGTRRWARRSDTFATSASSLCLGTNIAGTAAYVGGQFSTNVTFGPTTMTISAGVTDGWLGKMTLNTVTAVREYVGVPLPQSFSLSQNYPNPFNPTTTIDFKIASAASVNISVINVLGQHVRSLVDQDLTAGNYSTTWDGRDESNQPVSSGIYFYRLRSGDYIETHKMTLLK